MRKSTTFDSQEKGRRGNKLTRSQSLWLGLGLVCGCALLFLVVTLLVGGDDARSDPGLGMVESPTATAVFSTKTAKSVSLLRGERNHEADVLKLGMLERSAKKDIARLRERVARIEATAPVHGLTTSTAQPAATLTASLSPSLPPIHSLHKSPPSAPLAFPQLVGLQRSFQGGGPARDVRAAIKSCWERYKSDAWGKDELQPSTLGPASNPAPFILFFVSVLLPQLMHCYRIGSHSGHEWFGLGLTIIDSLDTLFLADLKDEFAEGAQWVEENLPGKLHSAGDVNFFEATIRVLGGLLSAHALSSRAALLSVAEDAGKRLLKAFPAHEGGKSGGGEIGVVPYSDVNLGRGTSRTFQAKQERRV